MSYISKNKIRNKSFCKVWSLGTINILQSARKCILKVDFVSPDLLSASSYGRNKFRIEFWSQCHIFRFRNNRKSSWLSLPPGGTNPWKQQMRIQECHFLKSALNHVLILQNYRSRRALSIPLKNIDLQNDFNILVAKQWKIRISVPMSYMRLFENLAVLEKMHLKGTVMEPKWDLTGT